MKMASEEATVAFNDAITTSNDEMNVSDGPDLSLVSFPQLLPQRAHRRPCLHAVSTCPLTSVSVQTAISLSSLDTAALNIVTP